MKNFSEDLRKHKEEIINHENVKMIPLTNKENKSCLKQEVFQICKKKKENKQTNKQTKIKKTKQVRNLKIIRNNMQDKAY